MNSEVAAIRRRFQESAWGGYIWVSLESLLASRGRRESKERKTISAHLAILLFVGVNLSEPRCSCGLSASCGNDPLLRLDTCIHMQTGSVCFYVSVRLGDLVGS